MAKIKPAPQQKNKITAMLKQPNPNNIAYTLNEETHYNNLYLGNGTEPGAISSDAIGRADDQHNAEQPLKEAQGDTKNKSKRTEKKEKKGNAEPVQNTSQPEDIPYELRQLLAM